MDNPIIFQILGALVALFFIYLTYMNTKTWRWLHVTMTFLVFIASFTFCVYAAMTLKTRAKWVKEHDNLETQLATAEQNIELVTRGGPVSLFSVREELARTVLDRGRVWRGCSIQGIDPRTGFITLATSSPPDPKNPTPGPPKKNNVQPKTILHAFREAQKSPESPIVPAAYIGEFRVTNATDFAVTLEPTMLLLPEQVAAGRAPGTWALYETMPVDGHDWFNGPDDADRTTPITDALTAELQMTPPQRQQFAAQLVQPYLRDGKDATDTDPPENVWYEVKFDQEFELVVDAPVVNSVDAEPFNTEGQAVQPRLRRQEDKPEDAGKIVFGPKEGQIHTAVLDQQTAESLFERGICKRDEAKKIYRRKLIDYERKFRSINDRTVEINGRKGQLDLDNKAMLAATAKAQEQQALVEDLKGKANDDLAKVRYESAELEKYSAALSGRLTAVQTELSQLYRSNKAIGRELSELTIRLTDEINRRSREATALAP